MLSDDYKYLFSGSLLCDALGDAESRRMQAGRELLAEVDRLAAANAKLTAEVARLTPDAKLGAAPIAPVSAGEPQVCPTCQNAGCYCGRCRSKGYLGPEGEPLPWGWERTEVSDGETAE